MSSRSQHEAYPRGDGHLSGWVCFFLLIMAINYLNFNLYGRIELFLIAGRGLSAIILAYLIIRRPMIKRSELGFLFLAFLALILGKFNNLIAINVIFIIGFVIASKSISIEKLVDYCFFVCCFSVFLVFLSLQLGITENTLDIAGGRSRRTFGFANTNAFSGLIYATVLLALIRIRQVNQPMIYGMSLLLFIYYIYVETDSRTLLASTFIYCLIYVGFLTVKSKYLLRFLAFVAIVTPILLVNILPFLINTIPSLDILLSFRGSYAVNYMSGFPDFAIFFGGATSSSSKTDMGLVLLQSSFGIFFTVSAMVFSYISLRKSIDLRMPNIFAFITSFWFYSLSESAIVRPEAIIGLVFWVLIIRSSELEGYPIRATKISLNKLR